VRNESHDTLAVFVLDDFENRLERSNNHILSEQLTAEFGKGFDKSNLRKMRQFYCTFPIRDTLCPELSWSHYRVLMRINDEQARRFYMEECAKAAWSVRQLERQINTMYYQRILASQDKNG